MPRFALLPAALLLAVAVAASTAGRGATGLRPEAPALLLQLERSAQRDHGPLLRRHGGTLLDARLALWRVPAGSATAVRGRLESDRALRFAEPERTFAWATVRDFADPLVVEEWWRSTIGIDALTPPGPGVPVSIVDSGVELAHEEFWARRNLVALNAQEPAGIGGLHGTMVASVVGAPVNGVGVVGVYPEAVLRTYDAAIGDGTSLTTAEIVSGILSAARAGRGVINLSLGGSSRSLAIEQAVYEALRLGSLIVAAAGNAGGEGNPLEYPAAVPHVVTVAATNQTDLPADFSSRSGFVDLAAPGVDIRVARPASFGGPYSVESGTSFAAPIVAGAAAWIWTVRPELAASQVAEILRRSARDLGPAGWDQATGYGLLDVPAALAMPAPTIDPGEPNDDIEYVDPASESYLGVPSLTTPARTAANVAGRIRRYDDPRDVFRVWLPKGRTLTVSARADRPLTLQLFHDDATTVTGPAAVGNRVAATRTPDAVPTLRYRNAGSAQALFLTVGMPRGGGRDIAYRASVRAR